MRLPIAVVVAVLISPASAHAGTVALEGTELVFRAAPSRIDRVIVMPEKGAVTFDARGPGIVAGAGCAAEAVDRLRCASAGVTAIRVFAGDSGDTIVAGGPLPLFVDLGPGHDELIAGGSFEGQQTSVTVNAGPGNDRVELSAASAAVLGDSGRDSIFVDALTGATGPFTIDAGINDDVIQVISRGPGMTLAAGEGDDRIRFVGSGGPAVTVSCGAGADRWQLGPHDQPGDGCAPHLAGITTRTVSRAFAAGSLTGPASGSVTFRRRAGSAGAPREIIARGTFTARNGALRVSLKPTSIGRRWLRRNPRLQVFVYVRTRSGGDRGETFFTSRIG